MEKTHWKLIRGGMYRPKGKTWPEITLNGDTVNARDNNSKRPSQAIHTTDLTLAGVKALLAQGISQPWPPDQMIVDFLEKKI